MYSPNSANSEQPAENAGTFSGAPVGYADITPTVLLTGASGLVGRFVLRELLRRGCQVAALVRPAPNAAAEMRVEAALQPFEQESLLPRPKVIPGELSEPGLAISPQDLRWLMARPLTVVHCAASIRFVVDPISQEPYRTNVEGTHYLLNLCRELDVRAFHYVSTAYVGCRQGQSPVLEKLLEEDSTQNNDYERSKIKAEWIVAQCAHIGRKTIHRPSIVVGDSQTCFTSTFHGFYAALQIAQQFATRIGNVPGASQWFRHQLGMQAHDCKNLVPVDWVAMSMVDCVLQPDSLQASPSEVRVLHWTNPQATPCQVLQQSIEMAIQSSPASQAARPSEGPAAQSLPSQWDSQQFPAHWAQELREQMKVYESYFNSDPVFDTSQARLINSRLGCPQVDLGLLLRLSRYALDVNFGWPRSPLQPVPFVDLALALRAFSRVNELSDLIGTPPQRLDQVPLAPLPCLLSVSLLGPGAPENMTYVYGVQGWCALKGSAVSPSEFECESLRSYKFTCPMCVLAECVSGKMSLPIAFEQGCCIIEGESTEGGQACVESWLAEVRALLAV